jgi:two-component system chemotaxis response regulator CheY/two-component system response regulator (stage 0 sporulation protein A)
MNEKFYPFKNERIVYDDHKNYKNINYLNSLTAIVVDDSLDIVELFSTCLELKGIKVLGKGYDGNDAFELFTRFRPDIVFLDIMMQKYDGFYALEKIREIDPHAKILMITADMSSETAARLKGLESTAVMYKPFNFEELLRTVDMLIGSSLINNIAFKGSTFSLR